MLNVSPYADAESGAPSWRTGERESAIVFLSLALYIILDVNVSIYRVFRRKRGLYYWSLIFATWGTAVVVVGNILKNLKPEWGVIWPFFTLLINGGWSVYAPAELLVLYSRLHLVNQNDRLHRSLLIMIVVGSTLIIIPNWVFIFPAYDIDPAVSSEWSPRMAIIDRVSQAGFTLFEIIISSVYIHSLRDILRTKINTRTRRVMRDLILVNVTVICMDLLVIILIFLDQANLAYPLQDLAYAFKFKIEFAVLNQLMAVAASGSRYGSRQTTWEEKRYRRPGQATILKGYSDDDLTGVRLPFLSTSVDAKLSPQSTLVPDEKYQQGTETTDHANITKPPSIITKDQVGMECNTQIASISDAPVRTFDQHFTFESGPDLALSTNSSCIQSASQVGGGLEQQNSDDTLLAPVADDGKGLTLAASQDLSFQASPQTKRSRFPFRRVKSGKLAVTDFEVLTGGDPRAPSDHHHKDERSRIAPISLLKHERNESLASQSIANTQKMSTRPSFSKMGSEGSERKTRERIEDEEEDKEDEDLDAWERYGVGGSTLEAPWFHKKNQENSNHTFSAHQEPG